MNNTNLAYKEILEDKEIWKVFEEQYEERKAKQRAGKLYYLKQKASGMILITIGMIAPFILDGDITASVFIIPIGICLSFTKEKVMCFKGR